MGGTAGTLFGRRRELETALRLLDDTGIRAIELVGEAGIGKTAILDEVTDRARGRGWRVLTAAPSASEVQLTFAALGDLIGSLDDRTLAELAPPQRRALEVALLRADGPALDARAVGLAVLATIRGLADEQPLLIAIDDLRSLDAPSAHALEFALRRIDPAPVAVLASRRDEDHDTRTLDLERALGPARVTRLRVGPLTLGAIHELLLARLGSELPRSGLVALAEAAGGNPFLTVELARELERRGVTPAPGVPLPIPARVKNVVAARLERVPSEVRELLLAAAELARPTTELLGRIRPDADSLLQDAADAGIVELRADGAVRFAHPLLARVPYDGLEPSERRALHARLAAVVDDAEERARHRALAATEQSAAVAGELETAAASAGARGAAQNAAELCRLAARLTPSEQRDERSARLLAAAEWHHRGATSTGPLHSPRPWWRLRVRARRFGPARCLCSRRCGLTPRASVPRSSSTGGRAANRARRLRCARKSIGAARGSIWVPVMPMPPIATATPPCAWPPGRTRLARRARRPSTF